MRGRGGRRSGEPAGDTLGTALLACMLAALLASSVAMVAAARTIDIAPKVGDILVFKPGARMPVEWEFAAVTTSDQLPVSCNLRPDVMASAGGSLVVEERFAGKRMYRVHWAGQHTSSGETDCGAVADLLVARSDLQLLSNAVGGPGVEHKPLGDL
jgi:hypothetical protein